jgi:phosphatidylserine decarboxylase
MNLPYPVAPGARRRALLAGALAVPVAALFPPALALVPVLVAFVVWFHRDPDRPGPETGFVSPADGRVSVLREEGDRVRVGVFMNVTDVHVNRAPVGGRVASVEHVPGGHLPAFTKASERNERVHLVCGDCEVTLIAGTVARRIWPYVARGDRVERGDRIAHVTFGSRADVLLPATVSMTDVHVETGDRVRAGETVLADD